MTNTIFYDHETINDLAPEVYMSEERILRQMEEHRQDVIDLFYGTNIDLTWKAAEAMAKMWAMMYLQNNADAELVGNALKIAAEDAFAVLRETTVYENSMNLRRF